MSRKSKPEKHAFKTPEVEPKPERQTNFSFMLKQEEADDVVGDFMDFLLEKVSEICFSLYIQNQFLPYCLDWARTYLVETLESQIICLDKGDDDEEASGREDFEPLPATSDSWAQGCVPLEQSILELQSPTPEASVIEAEPEIHPIKIKPSERKTAESPTRLGQAQGAGGAHIPIHAYRSDKDHAAISKRPLQKPIQKKKPQQEPLLPGHVADKFLPPLPYTPDTSDEEGKRESADHVVVKHKIVSDYSATERQTVVRLDPLALPQRWVCPQYEIVERSSTMYKPSKVGGKSLLEPKLDKESAEWGMPSLNLPSTSYEHPERYGKYREDDSSLSKFKKEKHRQNVGVKLDKLVLAKGVSLFEPKPPEMGKITYSHPSDPTKLKPIQNNPSVPRISVEQIATSTPHVSPPFKS